MGLTSELNRKYRALIRLGRFPICYLCGQEIRNPNEVSQDHTIPKSMGGQTREENLVVAHRVCNSKKGCMTISEWFSLQILQRS